MLRYYPPEKQGLRQWCNPLEDDLLVAQILSSRKTRIKTEAWGTYPQSPCPLRYYPPEKQGLRHPCRLPDSVIEQPQILSSRKTRIKTDGIPLLGYFPPYLRYYPPEKQGLRHSPLAGTRSMWRVSDTILQKNKD